MFHIQDQITSAIIDTGATASFIAGEGLLAKHFAYDLKSTEIHVNTADNYSFVSNSVVEIEMRSVEVPKFKIKVRLFTLPGTDNIMGHEIVLGLDAIRAFKMRIEANYDSIVVFIDNTRIAKEKMQT